MRNPLRSEAEAFRFLIVTIAYFAAIAVATALFGWIAGVVVFLVATGIVFWMYWSKPGEGHVKETPAEHAPDEYRLLVIANETVAGRALLNEVVRKTRDRNATVLVVAPALPDRTHMLTSDVNPARAEAQARLDASLANLAAAGIEAVGEVGAEDPLVAFDDAYRTFGPDEAIISTHSPEHSTWLERDVVDKARERFDVPITHIVAEEVIA